MFLIGRASGEICINQLEVYLDLRSDKLSVWNVCNYCLAGNQLWRREISKVFSHSIMTPLFNN